MGSLVKFHNRIVTALVPLFLIVLPVWADTAKLDDLFNRLQSVEAGPEADRIEREIWNEWSKSGSPAMDLLLQRGRDAIAAGDYPLAIEHLTALTDHAPDFAEGWNALATAYYMNGDLGPSVDDIAHTLTLNPRHFGALSGLGMIFEDLGRPEKALEVYRATLKIHPHLQGVIDSIARLESELAGKDL